VAILLQSWPCPTIKPRVTNPLECFFSVEICNTGKAFPNICIEDLNYFWDTATEILIGLFDASLHHYLFLYHGFHQFQFVTGLVGENCGHYLRITDDGGNHPRN